MGKLLALLVIFAFITIANEIIGFEATVLIVLTLLMVDVAETKIYAKGGNKRG